MFFINKEVISLPILGLRGRDTVSVLTFQCHLYPFTTKDKPVTRKMVFKCKRSFSAGWTSLVKTQPAGMHIATIDGVTKV